MKSYISAIIDEKSIGNRNKNEAEKLSNKIDKHLVQVVENFTPIEKKG